jgi:voltage-gated potassium channel
VSNSAEQTADRKEIIERLESWFEVPLLVLAFVWLILLVLDLLGALNPLLERLGDVIWIIFIMEFLVRFSIAPGKSKFLKANWLTAIALLLPALRVFRIVRVVRVFRAARAAQGLRLVRLITSLNRGMRALGASMSRRGFGYALSLTVIVTVVGAAGMYAFESRAGLGTYGNALWWTAMLMTTLGSEYWPQTPEGRVLCLLLSIYALAVFGYLTASIASFFIGQDAEAEDGEVAGAADIRALRREIASLRAELVKRGGDISS